MKLNSAYILSHNGLGDNITMIGAIYFLLDYYENIFFLCKDIYYKQITYIYADNKNIKLIPFDSKNEEISCFNILTDKYIGSDIFICGIHKSYLKKKVTHPQLLSYNTNNFYKLPDRFSFINMFYNDLGLDLSIFINKFNIKLDNVVLDLYKYISNYNDIIFIHSTSSIIDIDLTNVIQKYINDKNSLIICVNKNVYPINHDKYEIANKYVFLPTVFHYIEIIKNATCIHITDSCFSCLVIPLMYSFKLKCQDVHIYHRETFEKIIF